MEVELGGFNGWRPGKTSIPVDVVDGAREGGVEEEARKVDELRVKWIWDPWRETRESGRRVRAVSRAVHGEPKEEERRTTSRRGK